MLKSLIKIDNHGVYRLHNDVLAFFNSCIDRRNFSNAMFTPNLLEVISNARKLEPFFREVVRELNRPDINKQVVYDNLIQNNDPISLCCGRITYNKLDEPLYLGVNNAISNLYSFLWKSTMKNDTTKTNYGDINDHYSLFFNHNCKPVNLCPFCGLERYENPKNGRVDYDHYLYQVNYPELRINFDNLFPMPSYCNGKSVKHTQDILKVNNNGRFRRAYYPYNEVSEYNFTISCANMFSVNETWVVTLTCTDIDKEEEFQTWKTVFKIESRYATEIEEFYSEWIKELINRNINNLPTDINSLDTAIEDQIADIDSRAIVPGYFLHKEFWLFIQSADDLIKNQILFYIEQYSLMVA